MGVAEVGEGFGFVVVVAERAVQSNGLLVMGEGVIVLAEVVVDVSRGR